MLNIKPEFKNLIPPLSADEHAELEESILEFGCRDALVVWNEIIIDGHNRFEICSNNGVPYNTVDMTYDLDTEEDVKQWIIKNQFGRRNINMFQRSQLALQLKDMIAAKAKENQIAAGGDRKSESAKSLLQNSAEAIDPIDTRAELAKIAGVSHDTLGRVEAIQRDAPEVVKTALNNNDVSINKAYEVTKAVKDLPQEEQAGKAESMIYKSSIKGTAPDVLKQALYDRKITARQGMDIIYEMEGTTGEAEREAEAIRLLGEIYARVADTKAAETKRLSLAVANAIYSSLNLAVDDAHVDAFLGGNLFTIDERLDECARAIQKLESLQSAILYRKKIRAVK